MKAADAELFQPLDERRLGVPRRRLGEMLVRSNSALGQPFAGRHLGQPLRFLIPRIFVAPLLVKGQKTIELHDRSGRAQIEGSASGFCGDVNRRALELGRFHLAGNRA